MTHFKTFAGIICDSGAASISDCQVFVDEGMTNPKSKYHSMDMNENNSLKKRILQYRVWNFTVEKMVTKTYQSNNFLINKKIVGSSSQFLTFVLLSSNYSPSLSVAP